MNLRYCRCIQCRACRKHKSAQHHIIGRKRHGRRKVRQLLHVGEYEKLPVAIGLGYFG